MGVYLTHAVLLLGVGVVLVRLLGRYARFDLRRGVFVLALGIVAALSCLLVEKYVRAWTLPVAPRGQRELQGSLFATLIFFAPLEEACKALLVRTLRPRETALLRCSVPLHAAWLAIGFSLGESLWQWHFGPPLLLLPVLVRSLGHLFFAGAWAVALGDRSRFWGFAWVAATVFHGLFTHLLVGRPQPEWLLLGPSLLSAAGVVWLGLRELIRRPILAETADPLSEIVESMRLGVLQEHAHISWVLGGAFVTVGVTLVGLALTVVLGRVLDVDFSLADEADLRANVPIALLAAGLAASFVFSGYLVARASGTTSVIEPALAAALALTFIVGVLSVTAPVASVVALAVAPAAFALACAGAWFGVSV